MKKFITSAGLVAVGATGLQGAYAPGLSPRETAKPWTVSASLRGFYDDNYITQNKNFNPRGSFGVEMHPSIALNLPREQTLIKASYDYTMKYYENRTGQATDHSHEVSVRADHKFSERYRLEALESFAYSQEPEILDGGTVNTPIRTTSDAARNRLAFSFLAQVNETVAIGAGYQNLWYDYVEDADARQRVSGIPEGSRSALLDRVEHLARIDARWALRQHLLALVGFQYGINDYTSKDPIANIGTAAAPVFVPGTARDNDSKYFFVGAQYDPSSVLKVSARLGVQSTYFKSSKKNVLSPYVDLSGNYTYLKGSDVEFGVRHSRNATDVVDRDATGQVTQDQETTTLFASVNHRITARITANLIAQMQYSTYQGGGADSEVDNYYTTGVNLEYRFTDNWVAEIGYNLDRLDSDQPDRSFTRNRIYLGARVTY